MSHGMMNGMTMAPQPGVPDGGQGMLQQQGPIRQYHSTYGRRGGYVPRGGRGGARPTYSNYHHSPPGPHRYGHHTQGSERYESHYQDGGPAFGSNYRARGEHDNVHHTPSPYHKEYRSYGHHQEHKSHHSKSQPSERLYDSQKYDNNNGGGGGGSGSSGRRHTSRWDQDSKPEYPRAETSRSTPYERESTTYSSGQTARQSRSHSRSLSRGRSLSKEPAISMDGSPSRGNSPMRGRSRTRKGDSGSSSDN